LAAAGLLDYVHEVLTAHRAYVVNLAFVKPWPLSYWERADRPCGFHIERAWASRNWPAFMHARALPDMDALAKVEL
jgi:hypothetical protein